MADPVKDPVADTTSFTPSVSAEDLIKGVEVLLELISPAVDIKDMVGGSEKIVNSFLKGDLPGIGIGAAEMLAGLAGVVIPGSQKIKSTGRILGRAIDNTPVASTGKEVDEILETTGDIWDVSFGNKARHSGHLAGVSSREDGMIIGKLVDDPTGGADPITLLGGFRPGVSKKVVEDWLNEGAWTWKGPVKKPKGVIAEVEGNVEDFDKLLPSPSKAIEGPPSKGSLFPTRKVGKTRKEIEIQGGPLSKNVGDDVGQILDDHGITWEYHDNGGITAIEEFTTKVGGLGSKKKFFGPETTLRTIRNWLGY
jgi:hypothetical protein